LHLFPDFLLYWKFGFFYEEQIMEVKKDKNIQGAVMVVGSGIAGMQSALDLADSGFYVHLVEKSPAIGGIMAQLDKTFPTNDCAM
jgi:heterodisulfide reductase subunit A-like polyferredoxin